MAASGDSLLVVVLTVAAFITVFVLSLFLGKWIRKKTLQNLHPDTKWDGTSSNLVLDYPKIAANYASLPLAILGLLFLASMILAIAEPEDDRSNYSVFFYAVMTGLCLSGPSWMIFSYRDTEFVLNSKGVGRKTHRKGSFFVGWDDIKELKMSPVIPNHFVLVSTAGRMRIPLFLNGMADLASMLAIKVPKEKWGNGVEKQIERSVKGFY